MQKGYEDPQNYDRANFFVCWGWLWAADSKLVYDGARKKLDIFMSFSALREKAVLSINFYGFTF